MNALQVGGLTPFTTIDYPGALAAVVFCQGCPWRCGYCHNRHLQSRRVPTAWAWAEVMDFLDRRRGLLDAVVFSGGEPTLQRGLGQAIGDVRQLGFKVGLHTAGCYPSRLASLLPWIDWVGLDIKTLPQRYAGLTGAKGSGDRAYDSLRLLLASGVQYQVRITAHHPLLSADDLQRLMDLLADLGVGDPAIQTCNTQWMLDGQSDARAHAVASVGGQRPQDLGRMPDG